MWLTSPARTCSAKTKQPGQSNTKAKKSFLRLLSAEQQELSAQQEPSHHLRQWGWVGPSARVRSHIAQGRVLQGLWQGQVCPIGLIYRYDGRPVVCVAEQACVQHESQAGHCLAVQSTKRCLNTMVCRGLSYAMTLRCSPLLGLRGKRNACNPTSVMHQRLLHFTGWVLWLNPTAL
jgi:hypothetical protein